MKQFPTNYLFSDAKRHWLNGERLFAPDLMGVSDPMLYQVYVAAVRFLTQDHALFIALICGLLSAVMPWTFYRAARELGFPKTSALLVWAIIAVNPSFLAIYHYFMMETLLLPLLGLALWASGRHLRKRSKIAFLVSVGLWTLACLTKATVVPLTAFCLVWTWWRAPEKLASAAWGVLLAGILLLPNTIRTTAHLGFPAPLGNPWITKIQHRSGAKEINIHFQDGRWGFISPSCGMQPLEPLSYWTMRRAWEDSKVVVTVDPARRSRDWREAYDSLDVGWREVLKQWGENILFFLFSASWPDNNVHEWDGWLASMSRWMWAPLIFFLFDCNIRDFARRRFDLLPTATMVFTLFLMFQNVATSEGRYRKPLEPLLLMNLVWVLIPRSKTPQQSPPTIPSGKSRHGLNTAIQEGRDCLRG